MTKDNSQDNRLIKDVPEDDSPHDPSIPDAGGRVHRYEPDGSATSQPEPSGPVTHHSEPQHIPADEVSSKLSRSAGRPESDPLARHLFDPAIVVSASHGDRPVARSIPVTIYLSAGSEHEEVQQAVEGLLDTLDFDVLSPYRAIEGSWFRGLIARLRTASTSKQVTDRLGKLERALEVQILHKGQAEVDALQGEAVSKLLTSLESTPNALIQIGSVLLVKVDGVPAVRNLTLQEIRHIEQHPSLLRSPAQILQELQRVSSPAQLPPALADQD